MTDLVFLVAVTPIALYAAWGDLKFMKIRNWLNVALVCVFLVLGIVLLPFEDYALRLGIGLAALVVGFILNSLGAMGGGDAKYIAAFLPFVAPADLGFFAYLLAFCLLAAVATHRLVGAIGPARALVADWKSWSSGRRFPMGFGLSGALISYLVLKVVYLPGGTG